MKCSICSLDSNGLFKKNDAPEAFQGIVFLLERNVTLFTRDHESLGVDDFPIYHQGIKEYAFTQVVAVDLHLEVSTVVQM